MHQREPGLGVSLELETTVKTRQFGSPRTHHLLDLDVLSNPQGSNMGFKDMRRGMENSAQSLLMLWS